MTAASSIQLVLFRDTNDPRPSIRLPGWDFHGKELEMRLVPNDGSTPYVLSTMDGSLEFMPANSGQVDEFTIVDHSAFVNALPHGRGTAIALRLIDGVARRVIASGVVEVRRDGDAVADRAVAGMVMLPSQIGPAWIDPVDHDWEPGTYGERSGIPYQGSYWRARRATSEEPGTGDDWELIADGSAAFESRQIAAQAADAAVTARNDSVEARGVVVPLAEQVSSDAQAVETSRAEVEANTTASAQSADLAAQAAAIAMSIQAGDGVTYDTKAQLDANSTAVSGQVLDDGANTGLYGRSTPNNPATAWVWLSGATIPGLDERLQAKESILKESYELGVIDPAGLLRSGDVAERIEGDEAGNALSALLSDGTYVIAKLRARGVELDNVKIGPDGARLVYHIDANYEFVVTDENDWPAYGTTTTGLVLPPSQSQDTSPQALDARNKLFSHRATARPITGVQLPTADVNTIVFYGQSLAAAQEAWPALSRTALFGNTMLGGDVRPQTGDGSTYPQLTPTGFQPLVAQTRAQSATAVMSDAAVAALAPGNDAWGEMPGIAMANMASWLISRRIMGAPRPFNVVCPAISGRTIEQLSKVNTQDGTHRYSRFLSSVQQSQAAAVALGKSHSVSAIVWMQGEWDYITTTGSARATKALYKAALAQLHSDAVADIKAITGQTDDPILVIYQTGGGYTVDTDANGVPGLHVGMAQLEYALENPTTVVMAGPHYPVCDKGGHLNANGSRWYGSILARAWYRTVIEGHAWRPLSPIAIERVDQRRLRVHFHVPGGELQFASAYAANVATDFTPARGFRVTNPANATVAISAVSIIADTIVEITTSADIPDGSSLWYAGKTTFNGAGNLCDGDALPSFDRFTYTAGSGQYASENIAALFDQPYPAQNWCAAFYLPITYSEL